MPNGELCDDGMGDISTLLILWALSLVPGNTFRSIILGLGAASAVVIYAATHQSPSHQLRRVEDAIKVAEEIVKCAKANCLRDQVELMDSARRLLDAKLSVSKIQTRLLEMRGIGTWEEYLQNLRGILQNITECAKKVKKIQTSTLLTIEAERQRQISENIDEVRDTIDATIHASRCRERLNNWTSLNHRHPESDTDRNVSMDLNGASRDIDKEFNRGNPTRWWANDASPPLFKRRPFKLWSGFAVLEHAPSLSMALITAIHNGTAAINSSPSRSNALDVIGGIVHQICAKNLGKNVVHRVDV
ncbi:hypothetical protein K438DRAFT_1747418 [Mycena galopus ATCC 62051]|nr:hypothetical protein K438DRAFT_1747418 [Mycena galopus ATCC 62051]